MSSLRRERPTSTSTRVRRQCEMTQTRLHLALVICCVGGLHGRLRANVVRRLGAAVAEPDDELWQRRARGERLGGRGRAVDALRAALARRPPGCAAVDEKLAAGDDAARGL